MNRSKGSGEPRRYGNPRKSCTVKRQNVLNPKTAERDKSVTSPSAKKLKWDIEDDVLEDSHTASTCGLGFKIVISFDDCVNDNIPCNKM
ncbi:hypothetical protein M0804_013449 [Polistes exclamans]|nr:hypothetical protein M0804_013449 [Polistes exclamans]